jgi:putative pyruvate formate lyase activating enzyme
MNKSKNYPQKQARRIKALEEKIDPFYKRLENCDLCPRVCRVNRLKGSLGYCGIGKNAVIYTAFLHKGEEPAISGKLGSGTIFFSGCSLKCVYCQNYKFSHVISGKTVKEEELAKIMLKLQTQGAHNINLVTPTHILPQILKSLLAAIKSGLKIPIIYNTSGYEKEDIIENIAPIIDVYLADLKYITPELAQIYSFAKNYPLFNQQSLKMMYYQHKKPCFKQSLLDKGLIIRHLVLPGYIEETKKALFWIKENTPQVLASIMFQYQPYCKAGSYPEINRKITGAEYEEIKTMVEALGLEGWLQDNRTQEELAGVHFKQDYL